MAELSKTDKYYIDRNKDLDINELLKIVGKTKRKLVEQYIKKTSTPAGTFITRDKRRGVTIMTGAASEAAEKRRKVGKNIHETRIYRPFTQ